MHGEAASSNVEAAEEFIKEFVISEGYVSNQVFNCDETGLFWKKMPRRTYISEEEKSVPGHKPMKDRLTLLVCCNASEDCKIKSLLVYHSENPRVFKKNDIIKSKLNVMWRPNVKAWVTRQFFTEWIHEEFASHVKAYLQEKNLPIKALFVLDNTPAHPPGLKDNLRCFEVTNETELTLQKFWKDHYNILHCLRIIEKAWREVSFRTLVSAWKNLWPECVAERNIEGFEEPPVVPDIVSLGKSVGLEVSEEDVNELVDDHKTELTMKELQHLNQQQQKEVAQDISSGKEEGDTGIIPTAEIKDLLSMWSKTQAVVEKWHPDKVLVNRCVNLFNDNIIEHFRKVQKGRHHQTILERWFAKDTTRIQTPEPPEPPDANIEGDPKPSTSGSLSQSLKRSRMKTPAW
uniref:Tigger transposable element-derived protein 1-like n=1 Tax=Geotrypetes seraphini TaxID=260995 RepID=A0A6P8SC16_GEOSA|nr:tigger transposable element-derived protein 1-like [Geotrypetes seraphini]